MRLRVAGRSATLEFPGQRNLRDELLAAGAWLPGGCRNGNCGVCEAQLLQGWVSDAGGQRCGPGQRVTLCTTRGLSDLSIGLDHILLPGEERCETVGCRVQSLCQVAEHWSLISLLLPAGKRLAAHAGQYACWLDGEQEDALYFAAPPTREVQFLLDHRFPGHARRLALQPGQRVRLSLPHGGLVAPPNNRAWLIACTPERLAQAIGLLRWVEQAASLSGAVAPVSLCLLGGASHHCALLEQACAGIPLHYCAQRTAMDALCSDWCREQPQGLVISLGLNLPLEDATLVD